MRFVYLSSAKKDLACFRKYYSTVFPEGSGNAKRNYQLMKRVLTENPMAGHPVGGNDSRLYVISRKPFSVIYRLRPGRIEVLALQDNRSGNNPDRF